MLGNPLQTLPRQVQSVKIGVMTLQLSHNLDGLGVVIKAAVGRQQGMQCILARMPERRVTQIMGQRDRLGQFPIQTQSTGNRPRHLGHLNRMGQTRAIIIALVLHENLRLVLQPPKGAGMDDPVTVPLKTRPEAAFILMHTAATCEVRIGSKRCTHLAVSFNAELVPRFVRFYITVTAQWKHTAE